MRKSLSKKTRFMVLQRDDFTCQYCGRSAPTVKLEVDHIIPVSRGGKNSTDNLVTACFECNSGKSNRLIRIPITIHVDPQTYRDIQKEAAEAAADGYEPETIEEYISEQVCVDYFLKRRDHGTGVRQTI